MSRTPKTLAERLWPRLDASAGPDGCWLWTGPLPSHHPRFPFYPQVSVPPEMRELAGGRKQVGAHRAAWLLTHGSIPEGLCVCHTCDVTTCANPAHLWLGTHSENQRDAVAKGRHWPLRGKIADMPNRMARVERCVAFLADHPGESFTARDMRKMLGLGSGYEAESAWAPIRVLLRDDPRVLRPFHTRGYTAAP